MKLSKPTFASLLMAYVYNRKKAWSNFLIALILVFNIISHLFVFNIYKATYEADTFIFRHSLMLWITAISPLLLAIMIIRWRTNTIRKQEYQKNAIKKEMLHLEARALRAQMNPHFIFNCMNSIKALIQKKEDDTAVTYLTAFSKLIRTIFQNSDKREITLYDEIETCRLYTQLESMRFGSKLSYTFTLDESIDLKSVMVPALILQPFIENAIWHGIMPKDDNGILSISISKKEDKIYCVVEDNGMGREWARQHKMNGAPSTHQSKGVSLTQSRLDLSNSLNQRDATVEIVDKTNGSGADGTRVILVFNEE